MPADTAPATELVSSMAQRSGPLSVEREWHIVEEWPSFSARFILIESGPDRVVVKLGKNWAGKDALFVAEECARVESVFRTAGVSAVVIPAVHGVGTDPPAIAVAHVEGPLLFDVLGSLPLDQARAHVESCGLALGAYHAAEMAGADEGREAALADLISAARRAGLRKERLLELEPGLTRARGYRFSPNDFLLDHQNVVLLDPPHLRKLDYVHRDLGSFVMELHRSIVGDRAPRAGDDLAKVGELRRAFLTAYASTGPIDPHRADEEWVINVFETARITGVGYGRLRAGRIGPSLRSLRWAWWRRRHLRSI